MIFKSALIQKSPVIKSYYFTDLNRLYELKKKIESLSLSKSRNKFVDLIQNTIAEIEKYQALYEASPTGINDGITINYIDKLENNIAILKDLKFYQVNYYKETVHLIKSFMPDKILIKATDTNISIRKLHVASDENEYEGKYGRSQNLHIQYKSKVGINIFNRFGKRISSFLSDEGNSYNVSANDMRYSDYTERVFIKKDAKKVPHSRKKELLILRDEILDHKNQMVKQLILSASKALTMLIIDKNQLSAQYPCVIIRFKDIPKNDRNEELEGYAEFVTHLMIAMVNKELRSKQLPLFDRRQSFGFLTPTMTDVHTGVRLSFGLPVNDEWIIAINTGIANCDKILSKLGFTPELNESISLNLYHGSNLSAYAHRFLEELEVEDSAQELITIINKINRLSCTIHLIIEPSEKIDLNKYLGDYIIVEKNNKTSMYYISSQGKATRLPIKNDSKLRELKFRLTKNYSAYYTDETLPKNLKNYINSFIFNKNTNELYYVSNDQNLFLMSIKDIQPFTSGIEVYSLTKPKILHRTTLAKLINFSFINQKFLSCFCPIQTIIDITGSIYPEVPVITNGHALSPKYTHLYTRVNRIFALLKSSNDEIISTFTDESNSAQESMRLLKNNSDAAGMKLFSIKNNSDFYDTSEDDEAEILTHQEAKANYYTPSGMSALFAPMAALYKTGDYQHYPLSYQCAPYSYFEMHLSWNKTLLRNHFVQPNEIQLCIKLSAFKELFSFFDSKIITKEPLQRIINLLIDKLFEAAKLNEIEKRAAIECIKCDFFKPIENHIAEDSMEDVEAIVLSSIDIILRSFPIDLGHYLYHTQYPDIVQIDANPCVNREEDPKSVDELIQQYAQSRNPPKVLVLDTTSTTTAQLAKIISIFDRQSTIPILVTATSGLKHNELGLDCFLYGHNKIYRSAKTFNSKAIDEFYKEFCKNMKYYTQGTEYEFSRICRRTLGESIIKSEITYKN